MSLALISIMALSLSIHTNHALDYHVLKYNMAISY